MKWKFWEKEKRDPYHLREDQMTPEEHDIVFPPDDGIDFQWGPTYIKHQEVSDKGGKYWRQNADGSITEFGPQELRVRVARDCLYTNFSKKFQTLEESKIVKLKFDTSELAKMAEFEINSSLFMQTRSIEARADGQILILECILKGTQESTYFPAKASYDDDPAEEI